jgi:ERF superfamily
MRTSESIKEISKALSLAQEKLQHAIKDTNNTFYKSSYADLASCLDACKAHLSSNNLSVSQGPGLVGEQWVLTTKLMHVSGEWIESQHPILSSKQDAQGFGSGLTYARRYALCAIIGLAQADDDGNEASKAHNVGTQKQNLKKPEKNYAPANQQEIKYLFDMASSRKITNDQVKSFMIGLYGVDKTFHLRSFEAVELAALIQKKTADEIGVEIATRLAESKLSDNDK